MLSQIQHDEMGSSGRLQVVDRAGRRTLFLGSMAQTTIDLKDPDRLVGRYISYLHLGMVFRPDSKKVLFLGLGGGAAIRSFHSSYPEMNITAVDIDPNVVEVARKYFFLEEDKRLSVVVDDARHFLTVNEEPCDQIILDVYNQDGYPARMYTRECFRLMADRLRASLEGGTIHPGALVINVVGWVRGQRSRTLRVIVRTLQSVFPSVYLFEVQQPLLGRFLGSGGNNFILVATQGTREMSLKLLRHRAEKAVEETGSPVNLRKLVTSRQELPPVDNVPLLTDTRVKRGEIHLTV